MALSLEPHTHLEGLLVRELLEALCARLKGDDGVLAGRRRGDGAGARDAMALRMSARSRRRKENQINSEADLLGEVELAEAKGEVAAGPGAGAGGKAPSELLDEPLCAEREGKSDPGCSRGPTGRTRRKGGGELRSLA